MSRTETGKVRVFMMDLWTTVPYYTAYLSRALLAAEVDVQIGAITYYLDRSCFQARGLKLRPGFSDVVGRLNLPRVARRGLKLLEGMANLGALTSRFALRPPEIVHIQFLTLLRSRLPMELWFVRFCRRRGARLVLTVHDLLPHDTGQQFRQIYEDLYAEVDHLICHSAHILARLTDEFKVPQSKISVIPHGPFFYDLPTGDIGEVARSLELAEDQQIVLWQGIIFPYKGVDLMLNAWREVERRSQSAVLVVLGTGDPALLEALQQQAQSLALQRVRFDFRYCSSEELVATYRAATAVVYPYRAITTSGALATGVALGKPIVASNLPVFREVLVDGESALLVNPENEQELASALLALLDQPELRAKLANAVAAMRFGDQSWAEIAEATEAVYRKVLAREHA